MPEVAAGLKRIFRCANRSLATQDVRGLRGDFDQIDHEAMIMPRAGWKFTSKQDSAYDLRYPCQSPPSGANFLGASAFYVTVNFNQSLRPHSDVQ
jgi:hypothetical protein